MSDDPHYELWRSEAAASAPTGFETWVTQLEVELGHDLDGERRFDGYSLDWVGDLYDLGNSVSEVASAIRANPVYADAPQLGELLEAFALRIVPNQSAETPSAARELELGWYQVEAWLRRHDRARAQSDSRD